MADRKELIRVAEENLPQDLTSREALNLAAIDMNEVMGLDPGIDTALPQDLFMKAFIKASQLAQGTDNFKEVTWRVLAANDLGPERIIRKPIKAAKKATSADDAPKKEKKEKKVDGEKKSGIIATIMGFLDSRYKSENPIFTRDEAWEELTKAFPDRNEDSLMSTVKTQIPGKLSKERGYAFEKLGVGKFRVTKIPE